MLTNTNGCWRFDAMLAVRALEDIEYLVKESEVVTGQPGRKFVIPAPERLVYRIHLHPAGYRVECLNAGGRCAAILTLPGDLLPGHRLGEALRAGRLYTPQVGL